MAKRLTTFEQEDRILKSLKGRDGVATAGDVSADTGLGIEEVEQGLQEMVERYKSHLDVDDEGQLLYRFDSSFKPRGHRKGRWWYETKKKVAWAMKMAFKGWIMVTLVGYTLTFILLLLAFAIAGIAAAFSSEGEGGGAEMMLLPFYLIIRIVELVFWFSLFDSMQQRNRGRGRGRGLHQRRGRGMYGGHGMGRRRSRGGLMDKLKAKKKEKPDEPLYQKIFRYVFGPEQKRDELASERAFARFIRDHQGRVTAADWAKRTGMGLESAERALTASAMRFRGDINVSDEGVLVYTFDDLRVSAEAGADDDKKGPAPIWKRPMRLPKLTGKNSDSANWWISVANGFNLMMGGFVVASAVSLTSALAIGLGWIPLVFSTLFFMVPGMRRVKRKFEEKKVGRENERRQLVEAIYLSTRDGRAAPVDANIFDTSEAGEELVLRYEAEPEVSEDGDIYYTFPQVAEQLSAGEKAREKATAELVFGKTVFSSDEDEKSLDEEEMEEFDRRLARELEGDVAFDFDMEWEQVEAELSASVEASR